jgi:2-polyprenyl-3-methyl-5-hydroxy-6-metoxy-1,4-benzoquinol methylase
MASLPKSPAQVCDAGCGNGAFADHLANLGYEVVGFDSSVSGISIAEARESQARFVRFDLEDEVGDNLKDRFDAVTSLEVIEHLYSPRRLVEVAFELLRPGGVFVVTTPYHGYWKNMALAVTGGMDRHFSVLWDHGHIKFFSVKTLRVLLTQQGFQTIEFRFAGRLPFLWKSMIARCVKPGIDS